MTTVDRTPKPCLHKEANHQHGTRLAYTLDRCRCGPCAAARARYNRQLLYQRTNGISDYVDAAPVIAHVRSLSAAGIGRRTLHAHTGVADSAIQALLRGEQKSVHRDTADRILALQPDDPQLLADHANVPGVGTQRRLQALICLGWSVQRLAAEAGINHQPLRYALDGRRVSVATARKVAAVYERLWDTKPPETTRIERYSASRSRNWARTNRWAPPLAWDDDAIDDPTARPLHRLSTPSRGVDHAAVDRRLAGDHTVKLTRAERWVVVQRLHAEGYSDREIARRGGLVDRTILRDRQTLGLPANYPSGHDHHQEAS